MHPNRRRKKRPNYGIRTVEVMRGPSGFGFTISGQQPCILSCIVTNSPADQAGLSAGDFLISVNGFSVSKITHEAVVNLIGNSNGPIKMTIAENYYSDSSDEDVNLGRLVNSRKPKYTHKPRMHRGYKHDFYKKIPKTKDSNYNTSEKYEEAACSVEMKSPMEEEGGPIEYKAIVGYLGTIEMPKQLLPNSRLQTVCGCIKKLRQEKRKPTAVLMTVLPTCLTLKNAANHILAIYPTNRVVYISSSLDKDSRYFGLVTSAVCDRSLETAHEKYGISFTNVWEGEKKCNNVGENEVEISNSCHVFMTDSKIVDHNLHLQKAENFRIACTNDAITGTCLEFPLNALYIVSLVQNMYRLQSSIEPHRVVEDLVANSPQPSASSNSDSGIGFRDDCGNVSDRILVVEFPINRQPPTIHINNNNNRPINILASNISLDSFDLPLNNVRAKFRLNNDEPERSNLNNIRACETLSIKNIIDTNMDYLTKQSNHTSNGDINRLNCRALPRSCENPQPKMDCEIEFSERPVDVPDEYKAQDCASVYDEHVDFKSSNDNISMHSASSFDASLRNNPFKIPALYKKKRTKRAHNLIASCDSLTAAKYEGATDDNKLSPKVFGMTKPNFSCEELGKFEPNDKCGGSLRDLSSWSELGQRHMPVTQSEPDVRIGNKLCEDNGCIKLSGDGAAAWATSFEKLLECPVGLHAFAQFLKKEFSAENIYFWTACERYRKLNSNADRTTEAQRIYQRHLRLGACEAVNVDSQARQCVEQALKNVTGNLFVPVQKQIYNLMKFDSYSRFLKSDVYKQCLSGNYDAQQWDPNLYLHPASSSKLKKSLSNAEDRRRKSLLPWHKKNRSKSKDRGETEYANKKQDVNDNISEPSMCTNDLHSSKSSLTSLDLAISATSDINKLSSDRVSNPRPPLCRIRLLNGSTTVVQIKETESIKQLVNRLLEKRGINYSCFEVYTDKQRKALNVNDPSSVLAGCEVDIEQRISFRLDLPNKKVIAVKSKCSKFLIDVLRPILQKYSYLLEEVELSRDNKIIDINEPVTTFDMARLNVQLVVTDNGIPETNSTQLDIPKSLDEITNKVYEDILQEKSDNSTVKSRSDKESVKSEDWGSEHSGLIGRFLKKDSERNRDRKKKLTRNKGNSVFDSAEDVSGDHTQNGMTCKKPLIAKLKPGVKLQNTSESEELYEGLSRAQRSRLEDQRGTEINYELPDFLKNKENEHSLKAKWTETGLEMPKFYTNVSLLPKQELSTATNSKFQHANYENRILLTESNEISGSHNVNFYLPNQLGPTSNSTPHNLKTTKSSVNISAQISSNIYAESPVKVEPPPLPPKPKILPIKPSNWQQRNNSRKDSYLEQATSSFV